MSLIHVALPLYMLPFLPVLLPSRLEGFKPSPTERRQYGCDVVRVSYSSFSSPSVALVIIAGVAVIPVFSVRNLGVLIDTDPGSTSHVHCVVSRLFAAYHQLGQLTSSIRHVLLFPVAALVHSRLDYGNFILVGLPVYRLRLLQSVLNAAAQLTFRIRRFDHVMDALAVLH
jgi:hypothetical protein